MMKETMTPVTVEVKVNVCVIWPAAVTDLFWTTSRYELKYG